MSKKHSKPEYLYVVFDGRATPDNTDEACVLEAFGAPTAAIAFKESKETWGKMGAQLFRYRTTQDNKLVEQTYIGPVDMSWRDFRNMHG